MKIRVNQRTIKDENGRSETIISANGCNILYVMGRHDECSYAASLLPVKIVSFAGSDTGLTIRNMADRKQAIREARRLAETYYKKHVQHHAA